MLYFPLFIVCLSISCFFYCFFHPFVSLSFLSVCLTKWLSVYLPACLSVFLFVFQLSVSICLSVCPFVRLFVSICLSVCLFCLPVICPSACLSVCLSVCLCLSVSLSVFPPTSRSVRLYICVLPVCLSAYLLPYLFVDPPSAYLPICQFVCMSVSLFLSVHPSVCLFLCLSVSFLAVCLSFYLPACLSFCLPVCLLFECLFVCTSGFICKSVFYIFQSNYSRFNVLIITEIYNLKVIYCSKHMVL